MGYPGKNVKQYETPNHPFQGERIQREHSLVDSYGLKNKRELWDAESELRRYRREARKLLGESEDNPQAEREKAELLNHLRKIGILSDESSIDDILSLGVEDILERRLQTIVYRDGLANTPDQARQFITHGHIAVQEQRVKVPSYTVDVDEEEAISYYHSSPLSDELHPERTKDTQNS